MTSTLIWCLLVGFLSLAVLQEVTQGSPTPDNDAFTIPPAAVEELDKQAYLGRW